MKPIPKVGECVQFWLPGESPWVEVVAVLPDGSFIGRIDNDLINTEEHGCQRNDHVRFAQKNAFDDVWLWCPAPRAKVEASVMADADDDNESGIQNLRRKDRERISRLELELRRLKNGVNDSLNGLIALIEPLEKD